MDNKQQPTGEQELRDLSDGLRTRFNNLHDEYEILQAKLEAAEQQLAGKNYCDSAKSEIAHERIGELEQQSEHYRLVTLKQDTELASLRAKADAMADVLEAVSMYRACNGDTWPADKANVALKEWRQL